MYGKSNRLGQKTAHTFLLNQFIFCKEVEATHFCGGMLQTSWQRKFEILVDLYFFQADCQKRGIISAGLDFSFLCNYHNLTLKLFQGKRSYPDEGWFFIGRFKVGSVPGISVALEASKKVSKSIMSMMQGH